MATRNRGRRRWVWLAVMGVLVVGGVVFALLALRPTREIDPAKLATADWGDLTQAVVATGKIEPLARVEVKSKASGIVQRLYVDVGDRVRKGQVLVELDKDQLRANVREAEAQLEAARAALEAAQATYQRNLVEAEGPDVPFLKAAADRAEKLFEQGLISAASRDDARRAYVEALNKQMAARRGVAVSRAQVEQARAQVAVAQAALERARQDLEYATIVSPMDGVVLSRDVQVGDAVSSILVLGSQATLLMTLGDIREVYVKGKVDEADIGKVYVGQPARISVEAFRDRTFTGRVTKISPLGVEKDNVTTFEVRVSIQNDRGELRPNMSANAEIVLQEKHHVLLIPEQALIYDSARHCFVEVPDPRAKEGRRRVPVRVGLTNGVKAEVIAGLRPGDRVVLQ
jgi:HlyD family secretion protein